MRWIFISILILLTLRSLSQDISDSVVKILSKEKTISGLNSHPLFVKKHILTSRFDRDSIDFNVVIHWTIFEKYGKVGAISGPGPFNSLIIYSINDNIFSSQLYEMKFDSTNRPKIIKTLFSGLDTVLALEFLSKHNNKYLSNWTLTDLIENSSQFGSFGILCGGYISVITKSAYLLADLVKKNDQKKLKLLASSLSEQDRAFGTAGLYFLKLRDFYLTPDLEQLIKINQRSQIKISVCEGCVFSEREMSKVLTDEYLRSFHQAFIIEGLLPKI